MKELKISLILVMVWCGHFFNYMYQSDKLEDKKDQKIMLPKVKRIEQKQNYLVEDTEKGSLLFLDLTTLAKKSNDGLCFVHQSKLQKIKVPICTSFGFLDLRMDVNMNVVTNCNEGIVGEYNESRNSFFPNAITKVYSREQYGYEFFAIILQCQSCKSAKNLWLEQNLAEDCFCD